MKTICLLALIGTLLACQPQTDHTKELQNQINFLKKEISNTYKPGFGEFMTNIQTHHAKLWFAGKNENWMLADFEINEIREGLEAIEKYETERTESQYIPMINPALDSVSNAIQERNLAQFERGYNLLTKTCTTCHQTTHHEFIQITIPSQQTFSNQRFKSEH